MIIMKKLYILGLLIIHVNMMNGQQIFNINNCISIHSNLAERGDTLVIGCDSVYLLNKKTFAIYQLGYEKWKGRDINIKQAFNNYESMVELQSKRIEQQDREYHNLRIQFDSIAMASGNFIDKTGNKLSELTETLNTVNTNLNTAITQINESQNILKAEKKKKVKTAITWGVGGFVVGLLTCLLIL